MNSPERAIQKKRQIELAQIDRSSAEALHLFKKNTLKRLEMKTLLKEQHSRAIEECKFSEERGLENCFFTVADRFLTVYDSKHFGEHVSLLAQFKSERNLDADVQAGDLFAACWVSSTSISSLEGTIAHERGDALVACAGENKCVQVISLVKSAVARAFKGEHAEAVNLLAHNHRMFEDIVVSASEIEQVMCFWSFKEDRCVYKVTNVGKGLKSICLLNDGAIVCAFANQSKAKRIQFNIPSNKKYDDDDDDNNNNVSSDDKNKNKKKEKKKEPIVIDLSDKKIEEKFVTLIDFGFKSKSSGIDCIQAKEISEDDADDAQFTSDYNNENDYNDDDDLLYEDNENKNKKSKTSTTKTATTTPATATKTKSSSSSSSVRTSKRQILVAKNNVSEVSCVDFSNGFAEDKLKLKTLFKVENAKTAFPMAKTNSRRSATFGLSHDGSFIACGNGSRDGIVYVYDLCLSDTTDTTTNKTSDGSLIAKYLPHERHSGMMLDCIRSAAISKDCRHVLATTDANDSTSRAGILFRYEIIADQLEEYQPPQKKPASFSVDVCASAPTATALAVVQK